MGITGNAPTGTVTFSENGTTLSTATVTGGSANAAFKIHASGLHTITATYSGDAEHLPSVCTTTPAQVNLDPAVLIFMFLDDD